MIDLVAGYARGYTRGQIRPFLKSLRGSGYGGRVLLFANGGAALEAKAWDVEVRPCPHPTMKVHSARFVTLDQALGEYQCEGVLLADTRDIVFQKNPSKSLPSSGLHVFEEDCSMSLGSCPYNSLWIQLGYGEKMLEELKGFPISCVGATCGDYRAVKDYLKQLRLEVERIQPKTSKPQDQGAHNYLIRKVIKTIRTWNNEEGEVYTVGYLPKRSVQIVGGKIVNRAGLIPTVIHQWDRHENLKMFIEEML